MAIIFTASAESGNTNEFDTINGNLTATGSAKYSGNYGFKASFNGVAVDISGLKNITPTSQSQHLSFRYYIPSGYNFGADSLKLIASNGTTTWGNRSWVYFITSGSSGVPINWRLQTNLDLVDTFVNFTLDQWHKIELSWITGSNGGGALWVDDVQVAIITGSNEVGEIVDKYEIGAYQGEAPANNAYIYFDDVLVTNIRGEGQATGSSTTSIRNSIQMVL